MYQLFLGDQTFASVIDRITAAACAAVPGLDDAACRELVELIFRARVRKTAACGHHPACRPDGPLGERTDAAASGETAQWLDGDPRVLPAMFGVAAADLVRPAPAGRAALERKLAQAFDREFRGLVFRNPRCGHADVCGAEPVFPLRTQLLRR